MFNKSTLGTGIVIVNSVGVLVVSISFKAVAPLDIHLHTSDWPSFLPDLYLMVVPDDMIPYLVMQM